MVAVGTDARPMNRSMQSGSEDLPAELDRWDASRFRLMANNDVTYDHNVEVTFTEVVWVSSADMFHHPGFRPPHPIEREFARRVVNDDGYHLYAWDVETATGVVPMMLVAQAGPEPAYRTAEPLLNRLGSSVTHVGDSNGHGLLLKLAINISLASQMLAFSEGVVLAQRSGIDAGLAARVMTDSSIGSPMLKLRAPLVLDLPERAWFDMRLMHKDIWLALQAAHRPPLLLPAGATADQVLSLAEQAGYGDRDIAGMFEVLAAAPADTDIARPAA
jgi:hypothetical protein